MRQTQDAPGGALLSDTWRAPAAVDRHNTGYLRDRPRMHNGWRHRLLRGQALYYLLTGAWPIVHLRSFEALTGPKTDDWLVRMVGLLAVVIGTTLGLASARGRGYAGELVVLAAGSAGAFAAIDIWYAAVGRISPIYLADAALEVGLIVGLLLTRRAA